MSYKSRVKRVQQSFGKRPDVEYYTGDMEHIRSYYEARVHSEPDRFYIDTITWNDLDMDAVIRDYYSEFYGIELTEEDLNTLYNPPAESAWQ